MRCFLAGIVFSVAAVCAARAADTDAAARPAPDSTFDIVQYTAPSGWKPADRRGAPTKIYAAPESNVAQQAYLLIGVTPPQPNFDFAATFDRAIKATAAGANISESAPAAATRTRQGFDALSQTIVAQNSAGQKLYVRMVSAKVNDRMASFVLLASPKDLYDRHQAEMNALLQSVSFTAAAPGSAPAATPGNAAPAPGAAAAIGTPTAPDAALKKAMDQFAKDAAARRKPLTVSGGILTLDGRPIPNVAKYELYVGGTTIAGERTQFNLDVDEHGHFEQRLPDGIYKVYASCIVNYAGHRVPVDLVSLDGKPMGTMGEDAAKGIVKDFRLVMAGLKPGEDPTGANAWFGGVVTFRDGSADIEKNVQVRYPNSKVRVTFTPAGPLVDGSAIQPFNIDVPSYPLAYGSARFQRVPVGAYRLTATLITANGQSRPLGMARGWGGQYASPYDLFWESSEGAQTSRNEPEVFLRD